MATSAQSHPYPSGPVEVLGFSYDDDIYLTRKMARVQTRRGRDADYVVSKDYRATVELRQNGKTFPFPICVPAGYETDFASVPPWGRVLIGRVGPHLEASIVHDWLYEAWHWRRSTPLKPNKDMRRYADDVFLAAMVVAKVRCWRRWLAYRAVRLCGEDVFY